MWNVVRTIAVLGALSLQSYAAAAQPGWVPGSEIANQLIRIETQGVSQTVFFGPDGNALIAAPRGLRVAGTWSAQNNLLCLSAVGTQECWPYAAPFETGKQVVITSDCGQRSIFLPVTTNSQRQ